MHGRSFTSSAAPGTCTHDARIDGYFRCCGLRTPSLQCMGHHAEFSLLNSIRPAHLLLLLTVEHTAHGQSNAVNPCYQAAHCTFSSEVPGSVTRSAQECASALPQCHVL